MIKNMNFFWEKKYKKILSLDGGGVRGLASVIFLKELEKETGKKVIDMFDYFIGVSAGSLNVLHLCINKISSAELEEFWSKDNLSMSMTKSFWSQAIFLNTKPKYNNESKADLLNLYFQDKLISSSEKPVVVLTYDVEKRKPRLIASYDQSNISAVSAISASSAAPLYYPTVNIDDGSWLIDGGVVANNPSLIGYNEARKYFNTDKIKVFSIGAGVNRKSINGELSAEWGPIGWLRNDILGVLLESQFDHEILFDLIGENYLRVNSTIKNANSTLDDYSDDNLKNIRKMGLDWWQEFGDQAIKFIDLK